MALPEREPDLPPQRSFAEVAVELGFVTAAQVAEAQETQRKLSDLGVPEELPGVLVKKGLLSADQVGACKRALGDRRSIAGFEILERVGHGAMGAVYKARQVSMDRIVAFKVLAPHLARDKVFKDRFIREARALGRLDHLHLVHGIDVG